MPDPRQGAVPAAAAVGTLTVTRAPADGLGDQYPIRLTLDGVELAVLMPGESVTRQVPAGRHRLRATNTLMRRTVELQVAPGGAACLLARNRPGLGTTLFAAFGAGWLYVALEAIEAPRGAAGDG